MTRESDCDISVFHILSVWCTESATFTLVRQIKGMAPSLSQRGQKNCVEVNGTTQSHINDGCPAEMHDAIIQGHSFTVGRLLPQLIVLLKYCNCNYTGCIQTWHDIQFGEGKNRNRFDYDSVHTTKTTKIKNTLTRGTLVHAYFYPPKDQNNTTPNASIY